MGDEGARAIAESILGMDRLSLKELYVGDNLIGGRGIVELATVLQQKGVKLVDLEVGGNALDEPSLHVLGGLLSKLSCLNVLIMDKVGMNLNDSWTGIIAPRLKRMTNLEELYLNCNSIGTNGAQYLSSSLLSLSRLREVYLRQNPLGDRGCEEIINSLAGLRCLEKLGLSYTGCGDGGAMLLAQKLPGFPRLRALDVNKNSITLVGARARASAFTGHTHRSLESFLIEDNKIGDKGGKALATVLALLPSVQMVRMKGNDISDSAQRSIKKIYL